MVLHCLPYEVQILSLEGSWCPLRSPWQEAADWGLWSQVGQSRRLVYGTQKYCGCGQVNLSFYIPEPSLVRGNNDAYLTGLLWGSDESTHSKCSVKISGEVFCPVCALVPNILHFWLFSRRTWCPPISVYLLILLLLPWPDCLFWGSLINLSWLSQNVTILVSTDWWMKSGPLLPWVSVVL